MNRYYILDEKGNPKPAANVHEWGRFFEDNKKIVAQDTIGHCWVSTVFLGLDYNFTGKGPPILWETMVFVHVGHPLHQECDRCSGNREQAEAMHKAMIERVEAVLALQE